MVNVFDFFSTSSSVGETKQECNCSESENKTEPCDIGGLELIFFEPSGKQHSVVTKEKREHREKPLEQADLPYLNSEKYDNVVSYDAILEVVAAPFRTDETVGKPPAILSNITGFIGDCPKQEHAEIIMRNPDHETMDKLKASQSFKQITPAPMEIYAKSLPLDDYTSVFKLSEAFYMFRDKQSAQYVKDVEVEALSCGVRDDGEKPNKIMKGLIRIYRDDKFELKVNIPSVYSKGAAFKEKRNLKGKVAYRTATVAGGETETSVFGSNGDMTEYVEQDAGLFLTKTSSLDGPTNEITNTTELSNFVELSRNGRPLHVVDTVNRIIHIRTLILEGLSYLDDLKKLAPKVGFGWSVNLDVLAGNMSGNWGLQSGSKYDTDEYKWVKSYGELNASLSIIRLGLSAFIGIECKSPGILKWFGDPPWEIIVKVEISMELDCALDATINLTDEEVLEKVSKVGKEGSTNPDDFESVLWTNSVVSKATFIVQATVGLFGEELNAKGSVNTELTADMKVVYPFKVRGNIKHKESYIKVKFVRGKGNQKHWKYVLCGEKYLVEESYFLGE